MVLWSSISALLFLLRLLQQLFVVCEKCIQLFLFFKYDRWSLDCTEYSCAHFKSEIQEKKCIQPLFHRNAVESVDEIIKARKLQWITNERKKSTHTRFLFEFLPVCTCAKYEWNYEMEIECACARAQFCWREHPKKVGETRCFLFNLQFHSISFPLICHALRCCAALSNFNEVTNEWTKKRVDIQIIEFLN